MARTRERYAEIRTKLDAGESLSAISRVTGLDRQTVQRFARAGSIDELLARATSRDSKLDQFKPYLHQRWNEGVTDAAALHAELRERGWAGSEQTVRRYVRPFRQALAAPEPAPAVPKTRQITRWLLTRPDHLQPDEQAQLQAIRARCPHIDALAGHVTAFAEMMTARTGTRDLEAWLAAVEADEQAGLRSLAAGIRNDQQAVTNGLTLHWNSGRVEGTVNKIKMIKRQMYGRAGFDLLRKRVILHPALPRSQNSRQSPFFVLAPYIAYDAAATLAGRDHARTSWLGIALSVASLIVMPALCTAKQRLGARLGSAATAGEGTQNLLCAYLAAAVLAGLLVNTAFGWWWLDPVVALGIAGLAVREGIQAWHGEDCC